MFPSPRVLTYRITEETKSRIMFATFNGNPAQRLSLATIISTPVIKQLSQDVMTDYLHLLDTFRNTISGRDMNAQISQEENNT